MRRDKDDGLIALTLRYDRVDLRKLGMRVTSKAEMTSARTSVDAKTLAALELARDRILDHHRRQVPVSDCYVDEQGVALGYRWTAVQSAGLYVPGGTASYPSSVLMNALPAKVAKVDRIVMVVPAPDGKLNPLVLVAAELAGVDEIYRVGGAQAIAALAYGTETIAPVVKIVGPGNAYVAAAKRQVFGQVGIDMIAGPSEVVVIADKDNDPAWIAADLLAQAEHDTAAQAILITDDAGFGRAVAAAVETELAMLPRASVARASWESFGAIILVDSLDRAPALADRWHRSISRSPPPTPTRWRAHPQRRRDVPRPLHARGHRRLCRRSEPRSAHRAQRPLRLRARRARLHEAHLDPQARCRELQRARASRHDARPRRRTRSPSPLRRHQAERAGLAMAEEQQRRSLRRSRRGSSR